MQMTSKLEEPGRKAAIINKTKRKDEGTSPGVLAEGDQKNGVWRKAGICTNKKATRSPSRSSLLRRESRRKKEREQTPPHTPETVHKRERKTRARTHGDILRVMNMIIGQETTQLKETGRLHVTVYLTYPAPAPNREAPSDSRGDSKARELGRKKKYKRGGGEGLGREEGRGALSSPSPASIPGPHPHPRPATASGRLDHRAWAGASHLRALCKAGDGASGARLTLALPGRRLPRRVYHGNNTEERIHTTHTSNY
ncbi:uncharacterized protein LOC117074664 [Trachypithecus francoisi]|uniref:uncharacterized protein LOC117074664 n=1 Tax=Trachypithecus francoisi TaxID=54180 RepID=UPI00141BC46A|nr:uncharacterized protein LOC117074664 [Trachypithecus francoisi]